MDPNTAVMWILLGIFVLTALISLGSLVGLISLQDYYKKNLFRTVIGEVVVVVLGFGGKAFALAIRDQQTNFRELLTSQVKGWQWQYAEKSWRSTFVFKADKNGKLTMTGQTEQGPEGQKQLLIEYCSTEPFTVPDKPMSFSFKAKRKWTKEAGAKLQGQETDVIITFQVATALSGASVNPPAETWGMVMTPGIQ